MGHRTTKVTRRRERKINLNQTVRITSAECKRNLQTHKNVIFMNIIYQWTMWSPLNKSIYTSINMHIIDTDSILKVDLKQTARHHAFYPTTFRLTY